MDFKRERKGYSRAEVDAYIARLNESNATTAAAQQERIFALKDRLAAAEQELKGLRDQSSMVTKAIETAVQKADEIEKLSKLKYKQEMEQLKVFHEKWLSYYRKLLKKYPMDDDLASIDSFNRSMSKILESGETAAPIEQFERENERLNDKAEQQIGYVRVRADQALMGDDEIMKEILPDLPEGEAEFNPEERVREYLLHRQTKKDKPAPKPAHPKKQAAKTVKKTAGEYADRSESGFSFEEALNPKEDLADIMRDLGLFED